MENNGEIVRDVTAVHFLLMFGYKLFSAYFPLFLAAGGLSLPQIGYAYLLVYLPIALCAPLAGFFSRKTNPVLMMMLGIAGYAAYALAMVWGVHAGLFYLWQIMLGVSASLFFTSSRILLMAYPLRNVEHGFSWFYNAPFWADIAAPALGGLLIWRSGFTSVFTLSVAITLAALIVAATRLWSTAPKFNDRQISLSSWAMRWGNLFRRVADVRMLPFLAISLAVLWMGGLYAAFFVLFLKNSLAWTRDAVILYTALSSAFFSAAYILFIRPRQNNNGKNSIVKGALTAGVFSSFFVFPLSVLGFWPVFIVDFFKGAGSFMCNTGRSSLIARKFKDEPEEAAAFDTIFSPLGVALGSFTAGLLIGPLGYGWLFYCGGATVLAVVAMVWFFGCQKNGNGLE